MFLVQGHNIVTSSPHTFYSSAGTHRPPLTDKPGTSANKKIQNLAHLRNEKVPLVNIDIMTEQKGTKNPQLLQCSDHDPLEEDDTPAGGVNVGSIQPPSRPNVKQTDKRKLQPSV